MTPSPAVCVKTHSHTKPRRPLPVITLCARVETIMPGRLSGCISWQPMTMEHRCTCKQHLPKQRSCINTSKPRKTSYRSAYVLVSNAVTVCRQHQSMVRWSSHLFTCSYVCKHVQPTISVHMAVQQITLYQMHKNISCWKPLPCGWRPAFCCVTVSTYASSVALQLLLSFCSLTACALFSNL